MARILFADDDETMRKAVKITLKNYDLKTAENRDQALELLKGEEFDLAILDLFMPSAESGFSLLKEARELDEDQYLVVFTGFGTIETAVQAMKLGADDYITKDLSPDELRLRIERFLKSREEKIRLKKLEAENLLLKKEIFEPGQLLGQSRLITEVRKKIEAGARDNESVVFVVGESGTGKELAAREIHLKSERGKQAFVPIDCPSIPQELFESELFGYEKGAFTDAKGRKIGRIELANQGTLFLDEIADLPFPMQAKLLRFLENSEFYRIGGTKPVRVNARIISSTSQDLAQMVKEGKFRDDLFFRLRVVVIQMPPLREIKEDIPLLAHHFLEEANRRKGKELELSAEHIRELLSYDWPGNGRELKNSIESFVVLGEMPVLGRREVNADKKYGVAKKEALASFERNYLKKALEKTEWNITQAARDIGLSREELSRKIKKFKIQKHKVSEG